MDFRFAVLFIDIDEFKVFNDSLGHAAGDALLIQIAQRLNTLPPRRRHRFTFPAWRHFGGPLRARAPRPGPEAPSSPVLLEELQDPSFDSRSPSAFSRELAGPFILNAHEIVLTVSIGVAVSGNAGAEAQDVLGDAEIAMYRAKSTGKGCCEVFDHAMHAGAIKRLQLETDLRKAIELKPIPRLLPAYCVLSAPARL